MSDIDKLRASEHFDAEWYLTQYPDVAALGMDPAEHYLKYGAPLGRKGYKNQPVEAAEKETKAFPYAEEYAENTYLNFTGQKAPKSDQSLPSVSYIMTSYNAEDTIEAAIASLINQNYPNVEIVVCDDKSSDRTWELLQNLQELHPKSLKICRVNVNGGTYLAKNIAIANSCGDILMFQDSDDYSHPERTMVQVLPLLDEPSLVATRTKYLRFNPETKRIVPVANLYSKYGLITLAVRREAVHQMGFFDTVRKAGDDEWFQRMVALFGKEKIKPIDVSLYIAELRENSLIADMLTFNNDGTVEQASSDLRREYVKVFQSRLRDKKKTARWYRNSFTTYPIRPNRTYPEKIAALPASTPKVFANACVIPSRASSFAQVVDRLLPQVDGLHVFLDKFETVPEYLQNNSKVTITRSQEVDGDLRDNAKFLQFNKLKKEHDDFYYVTCDDDILYPYDYVRSLTSRLKAFDNKVVAGVHGVIYEEEVQKYFRRRVVLHFQKIALSKPVLVNNLGTGTVAFHSSEFDQIDISKWPIGGMVDIFFSKICREQNIPMLCIDRHAKWLDETESSIGTPNLFQEFKEKEIKIINELKTMKPWGYKAIDAVIRAQPSQLQAQLLALMPAFHTFQDVASFFPRYR